MYVQVCNPGSGDGFAAAWLILTSGVSAMFGSKNRARGLAGGLWAGLLVAAVAHGAQYELDDLGVDVTPTDINSAGVVVGSRLTLEVAFVYPRGTRDGVYADLFVLNDVNDAGFAVGKKSKYGMPIRTPTSTVTAL